MDQAVYSFLVGTFGGAVGGVLSIAVAMWYVDFSQKFRNKKDKNLEIQDQEDCPDCGKPKLIFDQYGAFCQNCKHSFKIEQTPSEPPLPQTVQPVEVPIQQNEAQETVIPQVSPTTQSQEKKIFCCAFCKETRTTKQSLTSHMKKSHPNPPPV